MAAISCPAGSLALVTAQCLLPKFAIHCGILARELRKQRGTGKFMILVPLSI
jgi:hypothetical protein